jgi:ATP-dependent helicase/nuclease subunit A
MKCFWQGNNGADSRAEVPIAGILDGVAIAGQIDRVAISERDILVADYKTNRAPPSSQDQVPAAYLRQMAAYQVLLQRIYPDRPVRCALIWTEGPRLMVLDHATLAAHAPGPAAS